MYVCCFEYPFETHGSSFITVLSCVSTLFHGLWKLSRGDSRQVFHNYGRVVEAVAQDSLSMNLNLLTCAYYLTIGPIRCYDLSISASAMLQYVYWSAC